MNQEIPGLTTEGPEKPSKHAAADPTNPSPVKLYDGGKTAPIPVPYESMVPKAIKDVFHDWASEVMNQGVHVHSKVIVIDPFGRNPVVITGSHNLGYKASTKNDDNMMIVEDNAPLAASYAANIIAIYQTYRWNTYVDAHAKDPQVWHGLVDNATWQDSYLQKDSPDLAEIKFWLGEGASTGAPAAAPAPGGTEVRAATASGPSQSAKKPSRSAPAAKKAPAKKAKPKAARRSAKPTASRRKAAPAKRAPAKSRRTTRQEGSRKDEARPSEKGAPEVQNSADEIDESRNSTESLPEDRFEDAAARQVKAWATAQGCARRPISVPDTNTRPAASSGRRPRTGWRTRDRTGSGRRQAIAPGFPRARPCRGRHG